MSGRLQGRAAMPQAREFLHWLQLHLEGEGVQTEVSQGRWQLCMPQVGRLQFHSLTSDSLVCDVWPIDAQMAELIVLSLLEHAQEFLVQQGLPAEASGWQWSGLEPQLAHRFQLARILEIRDLTANLRRVRLALPNLAAVAGAGLHVRLLLPQAGVQPQWPSVCGQGQLIWPGAPLPQRIYTLRRVDLGQGWAEIDILRHAHPGPGGEWLQQAAVGQLVGLLGPAGGRLPEAEHLWLVADLTGLPAAARIMEARRAQGQRFDCLILAEDGADCAYLQADPRVRWHIGPGAGFGRAVTDWLSTSPGLDCQSATLWLAGHASLVQQVRQWLKRQPADWLATRKLAVYWT